MMKCEKKIIDARTVLGLYLLQMGDFCKAKEAIDPIMEAAAQRGYSRRLSQIYTVIGAFEYWVEEDFPRALEHLSQCSGARRTTGRYTFPWLGKLLLGTSR